MPDLLNQTLYGRLRRAFAESGGVKIASEGESMIYTKQKDISKPAEMREGKLVEKYIYDFDQGGEYYRVNCPYCYDTRHRLYVSHMWGCRDRDGHPMLFLAVCYNEDCLADYANRRAFMQRVRFGPSLMDARIAPGVILTEEQRTFEWPGPVTRLDQLPDDHDAVVYVRGRGFDPGVLGRFYGAAYCRNSVHFHACKRIIIPVYSEGVLKGWQARYVGELAWKNKDKVDRLPPKYYTCPRMKRSKLIGNWDNAKRYKTVVLTEGWFDVFATGPWTGCIFGNFTSTLQRQMLIDSAKATGQAIVFMLDPEEFESESSVVAMEELGRELPGQFAPVKLPKGTDPGALGRDFLLEYIEAEARKLGVTAAFEKLETPWNQSVATS